MEIKHIPKSKSPDERAALLKDIRNACIAPAHGAEEDRRKRECVG